VTDKKVVEALPDTDEGRWTDAQVAEAMTLVGDVDSLELKVTVPASEHRATVQGLPLDPVEAEPRQVFFFDTPELTLNQAGIVVRARRLKGGGGDTVVKLRPVVPGELPRDLMQSGSFSVELDCMPGGFVCSGSLKGRANGDEIREAAAGEASLRKLLSKEQREFYDEHAPAGLDLDTLATLGPIFVLKTAFWPKRLARKVVAEMWLYPDGSRLLEVSTKCAPSEGLVVGAQLRAYLSKRGVTISSDYVTKTRAALEFYSRELSAV
jgi:hypothetical protein